MTYHLRFSGTETVCTPLGVRAEQRRLRCTPFLLAGALRESRPIAVVTTARDFQRRGGPGMRPGSHILCSTYTGALQVALGDGHWV